MAASWNMASDRTIAPAAPAMYATSAVTACAAPTEVGGSPGMSVSASASTTDPTPHTQKSTTPASTHPARGICAGSAASRRSPDRPRARKAGLHDPRSPAAGEPAHAHGQRALVRIEHLGHDDEDRPGDGESGGGDGEHGHGARLQERGRPGHVPPGDRPVTNRTAQRDFAPGAGPACPSPLSCRSMDVRAQWYDVLSTRISRRRFDGRPVPAELREQLEVFCDGANAPAGEPDSAPVRPGAVTAPARVCLVDDPAQLLFTGLIGSYGKVTRHAACGRLRRARAGGRRRPRRRAGGRGLSRRGVRPRGDAPRARHLLDRRLLRPRRRRQAGAPRARRAGGRGHAARVPDAAAGRRRAPAAHHGQGLGAPERGEARVRHPRRRLAPVGRLRRTGCQTRAVGREPAAVALSPGGRRPGDGGAPRSSTGPRPSTSGSRACTSSWARSTRASAARGRCSPSPTSRASRRRADRPLRRG